ncbi:MAG TPA: transketolase, partial [Candidatus Agrococcus pullicola]|nr:transketolase [Candidatus Agrococcus pullicola]
NGVGMAVALRREKALFHTPHDPTVWTLAGDGCMQEGVASEAASLAATLGMDNLVLIWDDNRVTIDSLTDEAFTEDVRARFAAYGWRTLEIEDATDLDSIEQTLRAAQRRTGAPTLVSIKSTIGYPASPMFAGTPKAHAGAPGAGELAGVLTALGFPADAGLDTLVDESTLAFGRKAIARGEELVRDWDAAMDSWRRDHPVAAAEWEARRSGKPLIEAAVLDGVAGANGDEATRVANGRVIKALAETGRFFGGSADVASSTSVAIPGQRFSNDNPTGEFLRFGIREHAMQAMLNGMALVGLDRSYGSAYAVFTDYLRPSLRLAALMQLPTITIATHDSVAVGEDGPTHQPVEQLASVRAMPGLDVVRPADSAEVIACWRRILSSTVPTALFLSRQPVRQLTGDTIDLGAKVARGAYVLSDDEDERLTLLAAGSELQLADSAAAQLRASGVPVRIVSAPCLRWFDEQPGAYRESVMGTAPVLAVEAGATQSWWKYADDVLGIDSFGLPGDGATVMAALGMTPEAVVERAERLLERN